MARHRLAVADIAVFAVGAVDRLLSPAGVSSSIRAAFSSQSMSKSSQKVVAPPAKACRPNSRGYFPGSPLNVTGGGAGTRRI